MLPPEVEPLPELELVVAAGVAVVLAVDPPELALVVAAGVPVAAVPPEVEPLPELELVVAAGVVVVFAVVPELLELLEEPLVVFDVPVLGTKPMKPRMVPRVSPFCVT